MATLPPRKNPTPTKLSRQNLTPLQTLLQMGFTKNRADKALAATGNRGSVQLASDWLLSHVNDPFLDDNSPREFILYACPTGPLLDQLEDFWAKSRNLVGWNGAHNFMPHITLVSFFKSPDDSAPQLSKAVREVVDLAQSKLSKGLKLELYTSQNFMGFFVGEDDANFLKRIAMQFVKEVSDTTISLDPHVKSLHLTLAYQFPDGQFNALKSLVEKLDPSADTSWELRLYSRDQRLATRQVHKIIYPYSAPTEADELELLMGDYVYLNADSLQSSNDGWVEGISWLTGTSGYLPINYTERCPESEAWVLHQAVPLCGTAYQEEQLNGNVSLENATGEDVDSITTRILTEKPYPSEVFRLLSEKSISYDLNPVGITEEMNKSQQSLTIPEMDRNVTRIFIMRHGERVDFTFGNWIPYCFDDDGNYVQEDLNMPETLPKRTKGPQAWEKDSPLTNVGVYQAKLVGAALRRNGIRIDKAYTSPAFRCVTTCSAVLEGLGQKEEVPLNVDAKLFEWCVWHKSAGVVAFDWLTDEELMGSGFNVNMDYTPRMTSNDMEAHLDESVEEYQERNGQMLDAIVAEAAEGTNILIVGHAATVDLSHQRLCERPMRSAMELNRLMHKISYCSIIGLERDLAKGGHWTMMDGKYSVTHTANQRFDSAVLMNQ